MYQHTKSRYLLALLLATICLLLIIGQPQAAQDQRALLPLLRTAGSPQNPLRTGEATYYVEADGTGNCSFDATPQDLMVAAMNHTDYNNAALCGAFVEITGPKGTVMVRIVDRCPECPVGNIDLSPQAFERIADLIQGRVPITWRLVSPELSGPIRYYFKGDSSQWWLAIQMRNHRNPVAKLEYRNASGQFVAIPRQPYNYFEVSGLGPGPYTFRVTDIYGNIITDSNISLQPGSEVAGSGQFPKGP